jgi:hypothetical protein
MILTVLLIVLVVWLLLDQRPYMSGDVRAVLLIVLLVILLWWLLGGVRP